MTFKRPPQFAWTHVWITIGAVIFLLALLGSALVVPELRLLHFFQALIYLAIIILARRNSAVGFGAGVAVGVVWNGLNLFVTHLMQAGVVELWNLLHAGQTRRLDTMMVPLAGVGHFILIIACLVAFFGLKPHLKEWGKLVGGGVLALAYLVLIVITTAPR